MNLKKHKEKLKDKEETLKIKDDIIRNKDSEIIKSRKEIEKWQSENKFLEEELDKEKKFEQVFSAWEERKVIGQLIDLVKTANNEIILIDPYIWKDTIKILNKKNKHVDCKVYYLKLEWNCHLSVFEECWITLIEWYSQHDRYLIIDDTVYSLTRSTNIIVCPFGIREISSDKYETLDKYGVTSF